MYVSNQIRKVELDKQRQLQIVRTGINVIFNKGNNANFSFLQFQVQFSNIISQWVQDRISLNIYDCQTFQQVCLVDRSSIYASYNCVFIQDRRVDYILQNGKYYILARNNATIQVLTEALTNTNQVHSQIFQFISKQQVNQISTNKMFELDQWAYHGLNESQIKAIELVTNQKISFLKGPPGCGKTKTIARLATIFTYNGYSMLIGAVSNTANMAILNSILKQAYQMSFMPNIVLFINKQLYTDNIQHPPEIRAVTFRYKMVQNIVLLNTDEQLPQYAVEQILDGFWSGHPTSKKFISIYYQAMAKVFSQAHIVIITTISATKINYKLDENQKFKPFIGILDQASQATWADALCFLNLGVEKMVFIGDDKQLTPTIISQNQVLKQTMFINLFTKNLKYFVLLNHQYRMHPAISQFPNHYFYYNQLINGVSENERASSIPYFQKYPVSFINSQSEQQQQIQQKSGKKNYWNFGQIQIIKQVLGFFPPEQFINIGIISPYDLQIKMIMHQLGSAPFQYGLTTRTCDGYQGSQKQYIILSCVRSNKQGKIGFCSEQNRLNVSITRAKRGLILIGNRDTFLSQTQQPNVWHKYLEYLKQKNLIICLNQLLQFLQNGHLCTMQNGGQTVFTQNTVLTQEETKQGQNLNNQIRIQVSNLQIQFLTEQNEQEEMHRVYKQFKKQLKSMTNSLRSNKRQLQQITEKQSQQNGQKQKQKNQQILRIEKQIKNYLKQFAYQSAIHQDKRKKCKLQQIQNSQLKDRKIKIKISHDLLDRYSSMKEKDNKIGACKQQIKFRLQQILQQIMKLVQIQSTKQFNHMKENQISKKAIGFTIMWALMLFNY